MTAWWIGATEWWADGAQTVPVAARSAAMLMLPAAVAWATPERRRRNRWLWQGALIVAIVQLLRYPASFASRWLFTTVVEDGGDPSDPLVVAVGVGVALLIAAGSVLGVWALGEGLKDARGRSGAAVVVAAVVALSFGLLLAIPSFMAGVTLDFELATSLLSLVANVSFLFVEGLLAGRAIAGARSGVRPAVAWRAGAVAATVLWVLPILSLVTLLANSFLLVNEPLTLPLLGVATYFGWPLFAVALATGMGRLPVPEPRSLGPAFTIRGTPRFAPAG